MDVWSASRPSRFNPQGKSSFYSLDRRMGGPQKAGLDAVVKRKIPSLTGTRTPDLPARSPALHNWVIPAPGSALYIQIFQRASRFSRNLVQEGGIADGLRGRPEVSQPSPSVGMELLSIFRSNVTSFGRYTCGVGHLILAKIGGCVDSDGALRLLICWPPVRFTCSTMWGGGATWGLMGPGASMSFAVPR
jgi:hypothetical protein